jgi:Fe-S-cluster containining protein
MQKEYDCDQCGACCQGHLIVEVYDIDIMREQHLATANLNRVSGQTYESLMSDLEQDGKCIIIAGSQPCKFLTESFKCAIYPTRPNVCVAMQAGDEQCQMARASAGLQPLEPK